MTTAPISPSAVTVLPAELQIMRPVVWLQAMSFVVVAVVAAVPIPILDTLDMTGRYLADGLSWPALIAPWNRHLVVLPRLLLVADIHATGGHMVPFVLLALLAWCAVVLVVRHHLLRGAPQGPARVMAHLLVLVLLFRAFLLESIVLNNGFNYPLTAICAVMAMAIAASLDPAKPALAKATFSALAALTGSLCLANGILALPIAAAIAIVRARSPLVLLPFGAALAAALGLHAVSRAAGLSDLHPDLFITLRAMIAMFGAPSVGEAGLVRQAIGTIIPAGALVALVWTLRPPRDLDPTAAFAAGLIAFGLGSAALVAIGRPDLVEDMGAIGRYALWPALVHVGLVLTLVRIPGLLGRPTVRALILAGVAVIAVEQVWFTRMYLDLGAGMQEAAQVLRAGGRDPAALAQVRADGLAPFYDLYAARGLYGFR